MKFPKSVHAEGWIDQMERTTPDHLPDALQDGGHAPLSAPTTIRRAATTTAVPPIATARTSRLTPAEIAMGAMGEPSVAKPVDEPFEPVYASRPEAGATALPPQRENKTSWMIGAGAGVLVIAALAVWATHKPTQSTNTPPAIVTSSVTPDTQVAAVTPTPTDTTPAATTDSTSATPASSDSTPTTTAAAPATPAPVTETAKLGPPVTTVKPAATAPTAVAQATPRTVTPTPAPRTETLAAAPTTRVLTLPDSSASLPPATTVAIAPSQQATLPPSTGPSVSPGTAPIVMPPTAAGPATATTPQAMAPATTPQAAPAATTPDTAVAATTQAAPVTPIAQAAPVADDTGITTKVKSALATDTVLAAAPIAVSTDHGVVKLEGQAPDATSRERATVIAAATNGVKAVDNRLTLPPVAKLNSATTTVASGN